MKAYSVTHRFISNGIALEPDDRLGPCVVLGEGGRGRSLTFVKLDRRSTPEVRTDGACPRVYEAGVVMYEAGGGARHALVQPAVGDKRVLVRISSAGVYTRGTCGLIRPYWGEPLHVTGGRGAFGDAGRLGTWADELWIIAPGQAVYVSPAGGHKVESFGLYLNPDTGVLERWRHDDFRSEIAVPWSRTASSEARALASALAESRGHLLLSECLRLEASPVTL